MNFIPETPTQKSVKAPFFEDSEKLKIAGRGTTKSLEALQSEIKQRLAELGAGGVNFHQGKFDDKPLRYGFQIYFNLNGIPGRIDAAALPMRSEAPKKKEQALAQALYFVRDWLDVELRTSMFRPGNVALLPYLIGANGKTVVEALVETHQLPMLVSGK